jgi:Mn2+/Fe2+ NRAMP family transporter
VKKVMQLALGIVTSIAGFVEVGSISTSLQAGATFGFQLLWAIALAATCLIFLIEMSGRLAAVSKHTVADAVRERLGFRYHVMPMTAELIVDFLVLGAEIGGACFALQLLTGIRYQYWAIPVAVAAWLALWKGTFGLIENGVSLVGIIALCFVVAAFQMHPRGGDVAAGFLPSLPRHHAANYWFLAVSIVGATMSPYLMNFYSSGAVEEEWGEDSLVANRVTAALGMGFGSCVSMCVLIVSAMVLHPEGVKVESFEQGALVLTRAFPFWGFFLFAVTLLVECFGAALEIGVNIAYVPSQALGWNWSENVKPRDDARFSLVYTAAIFGSSLLMLVGVDPIRLTMFSMALTVLILPLIVFPFLVLMNDERYLHEFRNGWLANAAVIVIVGLAFVLALVAIPLEILGGS